MAKQTNNKELIAAKRNLVKEKAYDVFLMMRDVEIMDNRIKELQKAVSMGSQEIAKLEEEINSLEEEAK